MYIGTYVCMCMCMCMCIYIYMTQQGPQHFLSFARLSFFKYLKSQFHAIPRFKGNFPYGSTQEKVDKRKKKNLTPPGQSATPELPGQSAYMGSSRSGHTQDKESNPYQHIPCNLFTFFWCFFQVTLPCIFCGARSSFGKDFVKL